MKTMIAMMNAMKYYQNTALVNDSDAIQEKLSQDISVPAYRQMIHQIHAKHFRTIVRK